MKHVVSDAERQEAGALLLERLRNAPAQADGKGGADLLREAREERARRHGV